MASLVSNAKRREMDVNRAIPTFLAFLAAMILSFGLTSPLAAQPKQTIGASGNPIPRFISIRDDKALMRTGPGRQYPIKWVFKRKYLPLEVVAEYDVWRQVRDNEGAMGWMHSQLFIRGGRRFAVIRGKTRSLFRDKSLDSPIAITAEAGVIGEIIACEGIWCQINIQDHTAWIERRHLWGIYKNEVVK
ncbi:MAG: hypothetical protein COB37_08840 [Kordiimonadales bacterium]|nr:MAG: hypothetical protein COB37_08840 [Kordiimonadales bacterium]